MDSLQDRYRLIEPLGAGGMSVVWRAYDEVLGRSVAVKRLATADDPRSRRRIQDEARAAALLSHPHIAAVHDFGHGPDGAPFVVMELVPGASLETRLLDGPLPLTESLRLGAQLASALAAVHARGLVHHDVKPANVMLTPDGAKLVDFGIAAIAGNDTEQLVGTPAYLAPERLRGVAPSPATDVTHWGSWCTECCAAPCRGLSPPPTNCCTRTGSWRRSRCRTNWRYRRRSGTRSAAAWRRHPRTARRRRRCIRY